MKTYFYVYRLGHGAPTFRHKTFIAAQAEAERLANLHPGEAFEILRCVAISQLPKPAASTFFLDEERIKPVRTTDF